MSEWRTTKATVEIERGYGELYFFRLPWERINSCCFTNTEHAECLLGFKLKHGESRTVEVEIKVREVEEEPKPVSECGACGTIFKDEPDQSDIENLRTDIRALHDTACNAGSILGGHTLEIKNLKGAVSEIAEWLRWIQTDEATRVAEALKKRGF
jgi:hypothetical protein